MTREERDNALKVLKNYDLNFSKINGMLFSAEEIANAFDLAIKALEQESSYDSVNSLVESKLKNPKAKTFDILHFIADNAGLSTFEAIEKAYNMGVFEQEPILDKIRAEIQNIAFDWQEIDGEHESFMVVDLNDALNIIDKYKSNIEKRKPCINYSDGCEEWAGCPCVYYKAENEVDNGNDD